MRVTMRTEISKLHTRLASTMIYVTHDQVEAMTMGDRICVMKDGHIMQVDDALTIYNHPTNMFVAGFIGSPPMNFMHGTLLPKGNKLVFHEVNDMKEGFTITLDDTLSRKCEPYENKEIILGIRPEDLNDVLAVTTPNPDALITAKVEVSEPMGSETYLYLDTGEHSFIARVSSSERYEINQETKICVDLTKCHMFDPQTENLIA
jgi:multiple sugar transport system ATP-binding protein